MPVPGFSETIVLAPSRYIAISLRFPVSFIYRNITNLFIFRFRQTQQLQFSGCVMNKYFLPAIFSVCAVCCCGKQKPGTIVRISNETGYTITDVQLITGTDTISGTSISISCILEDTVILQERERIELSWIENEQHMEFEKTLIDSVNRAKTVMFSILPDKNCFEVLYHF